MHFFTYESIYIILFTIILFRFLLNRSNLTVLVTLCLTFFLSYAFLESSWALFPLVWYFIKDYFLCFFVWIKTIFFHLKDCFLSGNKEVEKESVLHMQGKGKEKIPVIAEESSSFFDENPESTSGEKKPNIVGFKGQVVGPNDEVYAEGTMTDEQLKALAAAIGSNLIDKYRYTGYAVVFCHTIVPGWLNHLHKYGETGAGKRYARRNVAGTGVALVLVLSALECLIAENELQNLAKKSVKLLFSDAVRIEETVANIDRLQTLRKRTAEVVGNDVILARSVSNDYFEVSEEKTSEFLFCWINGLTKLAQEGKVNIDVNRLKDLPQHEQIRLIEEYNELPLHGKLFIKHHFNPFYEEFTRINKSLGSLANMQLVESNPTPSLLSFKQIGVATTSKPPRPQNPPETVFRVKIRDLPDPDNPNQTVGESVQQEGQYTSPFSPKGSIEEFSTEATIQSYPDHETQVKLEEAIANLGKAISLKANYPVFTVNQHPTQGDSSTVPDSSRGSHGSRDELTFLDRDSKNVSMKGKSSETQLVCKDKDNPETNDDLWFSPTPLEEVEKDRYSQLTGFGLCVIALTTISRIALAVLQKLTYTQQLIKRMIDFGWPKWLFAWFIHSNPGSLPEKPLFYLMICILALNVTILYVLLKMINIVS